MGPLRPRHARLLSPPTLAVPTMPETDIILLVARNIAGQRRRLGITQKEMARLLSLTVESVCRLEKGHRDFSLRRLRQFADIFGCRVIDLLR